MLGNIKILAASLLLLSLSASLGGCGCGFDCNNGNNNNAGPALLSLALSDALPEELKQVVIAVDSISFRRSGQDDIVVDSFTLDGSSSAVDSFQIDLLQYPGIQQLLVIEDMELDAGTYSAVIMGLLVDDINNSYVQEDDDSIKEITLSASSLTLPGMVLDSGEQLFTIEFGLAQSLRYQSSSDNYLLTATGVRVEDNATAARLSGRVDSALFDAVSPCDEKEDPEAGNRIYLYEGTGLATTDLSDVFTTSSSNDIPEDALAPLAVATLLENSLGGGWEYAFGLLPAGDYTMAFACDTQTDDAVDFDDLLVPLPEEQLYELTLAEGASSVCDLADGASCD